MTTAKTTTPATAPPSSDEAAGIIEEMAAKGITMGENDKQTLEEYLVDSGPKTELIQKETVGEFSGAANPLNPSMVPGVSQAGLQNDFTSPMAATTYSEDGRIHIYNRYTGEEILCNVNMVPAKMKNRVNDSNDPNYGKLLWTLNDPGFRPKPGTYMCWLHKDGAWRELANEWNRPFCKKSNISSTFEVIQHMRNKHTRDFQAITEHKTESERQEDRKVQQGLLESMAAIARGNAHAPIVTDEVSDEKEPVTFSEEIHVATGDSVGKFPPEKTAPVDIWKDAHKSKDRPRECPMDDCDWITRSKSNKVARSVIGRHRKEKHPETLNA